MHHYRSGNRRIQRICIFNRNIQFFIRSRRHGGTYALPLVAHYQSKLFDIAREVRKFSRSFIEFGRNDGKALRFKRGNRFRKFNTLDIGGNKSPRCAANDLFGKRICAVVGKNAAKAECRGGADYRTRISGIANAVKQDKSVRSFRIFLRNNCENSSGQVENTSRMFSGAISVTNLAPSTKKPSADGQERRRTIFLTVSFCLEVIFNGEIPIYSVLLFPSICAGAFRANIHHNISPKAKKVNR